LGVAKVERHNARLRGDSADFACGLLIAEATMCRLVTVASALLIFCGTAFAQSSRPSSPSPPAQKSAAEMQAIKDRVAEWLKTCMADWDQATHMTKREWRATCERVATERGKFLLDDPSSALPIVVPKGRQGSGHKNADEGLASKLPSKAVP
jgi:hypothetical protein